MDRPTNLDPKKHLEGVLSSGMPQPGKTTAAAALFLGEILERLILAFEEPDEPPALDFDATARKIDEKMSGMLSQNQTLRASVDRITEVARSMFRDPAGEPDPPCPSAPPTWSCARASLDADGSLAAAFDKMHAAAERVSAARDALVEKSLAAVRSAQVADTDEHFGKKLSVYDATVLVAHDAERAGESSVKAFDDVVREAEEIKAKMAAAIDAKAVQRLKEGAAPARPATLVDEWAAEDHGFSRRGIWIAVELSGEIVARRMADGQHVIRFDDLEDLEKWARFLTEAAHALKLKESAPRPVDGLPPREGVVPFDGYIVAAFEGCEIVVRLVIDGEELIRFADLDVMTWWAQLLTDAVERFGGAP